MTDLPKKSDEKFSWFIGKMQNIDTFPYRFYSEMELKELDT